MKNLKLLIIALFATVSVFAMDPGKKVKESFKTDYSNAENAVWEKTGKFYYVNFNVDDINSKAIYTENGVLVKLIQYVKEDQLPLSIRKDIKSAITKKEKISFITVVSTEEATNYYVRTEDDKKWYMYRIDESGTAELVEKYKKA